MLLARLLPCHLHHARSRRRAFVIAHGLLATHAHGSSWLGQKLVRARGQEQVERQKRMEVSGGAQCASMQPKFVRELLVRGQVDQLRTLDLRQ